MEDEETKTDLYEMFVVHERKERMAVEVGWKGGWEGEKSSTRTLELKLASSEQSRTRKGRDPRNSC